MRVNRFKSEDENIDLDLAPMLSMIVALIPILLLSFAFFHLKTADAFLPIPSKSSKKDVDQKKKKLRLEVAKSGKISIKFLKGKTVLYRKTVRGKDFKKNLETLNKELIRLKKKNPMTSAVEIKIAESVSYENVVFLIDSVRKVKSKDHAIEFVDPETKTKQKTEWLFPNVAFNEIFGA